MKKIVKALQTLHHHFKKFPKSLRFMVVGGVNTVVSYLIFLVLYGLLEQVLYTLMILALSYITSITFSYVTLKIFVFETKRWSWQEYIRNYVTYGGMFILNAVMLWAWEQMDISVPIGQGITVVLLATLTYFSHKYYSFKEKTRP